MLDKIMDNMFKVLMFVYCVICAVVFINGLNCNEFDMLKEFLCIVGVLVFGGAFLLIDRLK